MCDCLGKLQTVNLKWNTSIRSVAKDTEKMIGSSLRDASWLLLSGFIFSDQTKSFVLLLCLVWSCAMLTFQPWPSSKSFKRFIRHVVFSSLQHLFFYRRNVCLLYRYFDGEMSRWNLLFTSISSNFYSEETPCQVHAVESHAFPPHSIWKWGSSIWTAFLGNFTCVEQTRDYICFSEHCNLNLFKSGSITIIFYLFFLKITHHVYLFLL